MIEILLGEDSFSKWQYVKKTAIAEKADIESYGSENLPVSLERFTERSLFGSKKIFVLENIAEKFDWQKTWDLLSSEPNIIFVIQNNIDKRTLVGKFLSASKNTSHFELPHGEELNKWLANAFVQKGLTVDEGAVEALAVKLGRDNSIEIKAGGKIIELKEGFDLWKANNEVNKLSAYAMGRQVTLEDVDELVGEMRGADVFSITNSIADKNYTEAFSLINYFFENNATDQKSAAIQICSLFSEQFRGLAIVKKALHEKLSENEILELTGWKPGRLFMMKKISSRFEERKIFEFLSRLQSLDEEIKTSTLPVRLIINMIITQLK